MRVGTNLQQVVDSYPPGTHFVIASGVHRMQKIKPKNGMTFTGEPGAVLSGAKVLGSFTRDGSLWVASGQTQQGTAPGCTYIPGCLLAGYERDNYPEELFLSGVPLRHVASKTAVVPGKWFFDYAADKIYLADDPTGRLVETSAADVAFYGPGVKDVVVENLTVRHYANPTQSGAINAKDTLNWTIRRVDASYNHAYGVAVGPGTHLESSKLTYNGQLGFGGGGEGTATAPMRIEDNEISYNRRLGYNWGWEGGGLKVAVSTGTVFTNNWVHHNGGPGVWFDVYNRAATIESNLVEHNTHTGIYYEISYGPTVIKWNTVRFNGAGQPGAIGAGIRIDNSREVDVIGNAVDSNERGIMLTMVNRGRGPDGSLELTNVKVRGNDVRMVKGSTGLVDETGNDAYYTSKGNVFEGNVYRLDNQNAGRFSWTGRWQPHTWGGWRGFGNDASGQILNVTQVPSLPVGAHPFSLGILGPIG